ncbi:O-acetyl-ADP-ribose deacetylase [Zhongshania guokunii]|uniref:O-acetyl-ADP-ribose deacetylase n=1 Tax=Zhongshania guokunii TaxID=641783 RepID=A0ABV3U4Y6_9GAMM
MATFHIVEGDICTMAVDAIVNAANNSLLGGGGVDGAIHRAAGPELLAYCRQLQGCETGDAKLSPAFLLPAKAVIHTVGPVWRGGAHGEAALLASCYRRCIEVADAEGFRSIAFPAISCGVYAYPNGPATEIAVAALRRWAANSSVEDIYLLAFSTEMRGHWAAAIAATEA